MTVSTKSRRSAAPSRLAAEEDSRCSANAAPSRASSAGTIFTRCAARPCARTGPSATRGGGRPFSSSAASARAGAASARSRGARRIPPIPTSPMRIAQAASAMNLENVIVTSVTQGRSAPTGGRAPSPRRCARSSASRSRPSSRFSSPISAAASSRSRRFSPRAPRFSPTTSKRSAVSTRRRAGAPITTDRCSFFRKRNGFARR